MKMQIFKWPRTATGNSGFVCVNVCPAIKFSISLSLPLSLTLTLFLCKNIQMVLAEGGLGQLEAKVKRVKNYEKK